MWIKLSKEVENGGLPSFVKHFGLKKELEKAELEITATGIFSVKINEKEIPDLFMPGWTDYNKYINLCVYDVTDFLKGENVIAATVANGWYRGKLGCCTKTDVYGSELRLFARLKLLFKGGEEEIIETDESWGVAVSNVVKADFFDGEVVDFRRGKNNEKPLYKAINADFSARLDKYSYESARVKEEILPKVIFEDETTIRYDFGNNFAGNVRFEAYGKEGDKVTVKYAEVLNADGSLYTANLRRAKCTDELTLSGDIGGDLFDPKFTYHGFRFAEIKKDAGVEIRELKGLLITQDIEYYGSFECSDKIINGVYEMAKNGQKSNFVSIPTDCPQRDERVGWTGDAEVFCNSAMYNADCEKFFKNYMKLVRTDVLPDGKIPSFAPFHTPVSPTTAGVPGWADCVTVIPYFHYLHYRDKSVITENLAVAKGWVDYYLKNSENYVVKIQNEFGDWLSVDNRADKDVINQCFFGYSSLLLSRMFAVAGDEKSAGKYNEVYENAKKAFGKEYFKDGIIKSDAETVYALAYFAGFITTAETKNRLPYVVRKTGYLTTGFIGIRFILPALCEIGETDLAYELISRTEYPSWGYMLENGATTVWERWNGYTEENGFEDPEMNSFNHYSLGSCVEWLYSYVLGIKLSLNSEIVTIKPSFTDKISYAKGGTKVKNGKISVSWKNKKTAVTLEVKADEKVCYKVETDGYKIVSSVKNGNNAVYELEPVAK